MRLFKKIIIGYIIFSVTILFARSVKITKIIDTNLFEINKCDTVKLANLDIPSKTTKDSLLLKYFIPYVLKYEYNKLSRKYFIMKYADSSDVNQQIRSVYLYENHPLSKELINDDFLLKGYGKYVPVRDSEEQIICEKAALKAREDKRGIWNSGQYFHKDLGMREAAFHYGYGQNSDNDSYTKYMISFQNEQNRSFSAKIQLSWYRRQYIDNSGYYLDREYPHSTTKINNDILLNAELNGNAAYFGIKLLLRAYYTHLESGSSGHFYPFMPGLGVNMGIIRTAYLTLTFLPVSENNYYYMSVSAHYFFPQPFCSIHFHYYFNPYYDSSVGEYRLRINFSLKKKISFVIDASTVMPVENGLTNNYFSLDFGIGYLLR